MPAKKLRIILRVFNSFVPNEFKFVVRISDKALLLKYTLKMGKISQKITSLNSRSNFILFWKTDTLSLCKMAVKYPIQLRASMRHWLPCTTIEETTLSSFVAQPPPPSTVDTLGNINSNGDDNEWIFLS